MVISFQPSQFKEAAWYVYWRLIKVGIIQIDYLCLNIIPNDYDSVIGLVCPIRQIARAHERNDWLTIIQHSKQPIDVRDTVGHR